MICQKCGQEGACVQLTDIIDGEKRSRLLCQQCAGELGFVIDSKLIQAATAQLQKLIAPLMQSQAHEACPETCEGTEPGVACPLCGMTCEEFQRHNRLGCPEDYEIFKEFLDNLLLEIQGANRHRGQIPEHHQERWARQKRLQALKKELEEAVVKEEFERAAEIRDTISNLESRQDGHAPTP